MLRLCLMLSICFLTSCFAWSTASAQAKNEPTLRDIKPLVLDLNPKPGVTERHIGLQAHIDADPGSDQSTLTAFAQKLFEDRLRSELSQQPNANLAFITFYLGPAVVNGQTMTRTFRVVYQLKNGSWGKLGG